MAILLRVRFIHSFSLELIIIVHITSYHFCWHVCKEREVGNICEFSFFICMRRNISVFVQSILLGSIKNIWKKYSTSDMDQGHLNIIVWTVDDKQMKQWLQWQRRSKWYFGCYWTYFGGWCTVTFFFIWWSNIEGTRWWFMSPPFVVDLLFRNHWQ